MDVDAVTLPPALRVAPTFGFVGRDEEMAALRAEWVAAAHGRRLALLSGQAGTGKSRLIRELAHFVASDGGTVLYGACDPTTAVAYQPVTDALRHLLRQSDPATLTEDIGPLGGELTRLLPELPRHVEALPLPLTSNAETERHRLHSALLDLLVNSSSRRPVLLILDDLHWADRGTMQLLRRVMRVAVDMRLLIIGAFRDGDSDASDLLAEALADWARLDGDVLRLRLDGLDRPAMEAFVDHAGGAADDADRVTLVDALCHLTGGNAFLVGEVWRHLTEVGVLAVHHDGWRIAGSLERVESPESVTQVVARRLARLAPATRELLEIAATVGPTVHMALLRGVSTTDETTLLAALEEAVKSGTLQPTGDVRQGYGFSHELVRRAIGDRLNAVAQARLHLRIAEALERMPGEEPSVVFDLADHFTAAAPVDGEARAAAHCIRAAEASRRQLDFDQAARYLQTALDLGVPAAQQMGVHRRRGDALRAAGRWREALTAYRSSADLARATEDRGRLAAAALGFEETCWRPGITNEGAAEMLTEAARALGEDDPGMRVRLLAALARAHGYRREVDEAATAYQAAEALARTLDEPLTLAQVLAQAYWGRGTTPAEDVAAAMAEGLAIATRLGDLELMCSIRSWRGVLLAEMGRFDELESENAAFLASAEQLGQQIFLYHHAHAAATVALCRGQLARAEAMALRALELSAVEDGDASGGHGIQMFGIRREQDRLGELAPALRVLAVQPESTVLWRPGLAVLYAELGMHEEAGREVARLCADEFAEVPDDGLRIASLIYLAEACYLIGDSGHAGLLYDELAPSAGTLTIVAGLVACYGALDRHLGMLASCMQDHSRAEAHLTAALAQNERAGSPTWWGHTAYQLGRTLRERGRPGDAERAQALLSEARRTAVRLSLTALVRYIDALDAPAAAPAPLPDGLTPREVDVLEQVTLGKSNRQIGAALFISANTAANHVRSILMKTGSANRTEAASYAHRHGLVDGPPGTSAPSARR